MKSLNYDQSLALTYDLSFFNSPPKQKHLRVFERRFLRFITAIGSADNLSGILNSFRMTTAAPRVLIYPQIQFKWDIPAEIKKNDQRCAHLCFI